MSRSKGINDVESPSYRGEGGEVLFCQVVYEKGDQAPWLLSETWAILMGTGGALREGCWPGLHAHHCSFCSVGQRETQESFKAGFGWDKRVALSLSAQRKSRLTSSHSWSRAKHLREERYLPRNLEAASGTLSSPTFPFCTG